MKKGGLPQKMTEEKSWAGTSAARSSQESSSGVRSPSPADMERSGSPEDDPHANPSGASDHASSQEPDTPESSQEPSASETPRSTSSSLTPQTSQDDEPTLPEYSFSNTWNMVTGFMTSNVSSLSPGSGPEVNKKGDHSNRRKSHPKKLAVPQEQDGGSAAEAPVKEEEGDDRQVASPTHPELDGLKGSSVEDAAEKSHNFGMTEIRSTGTRRTRKARQEQICEDLHRPRLLRSAVRAPGLVLVVPDEETGSAADPEETRKRRRMDELPELHGCDICDECFPTPEEAEAHLVTHFNEPGEDFDCEECGKVFDSASELDDHRARKHGKLRYCCDICGIQYNYQSQFVIHMRAHSGERPYTCDECGQTFGHKCSLVIHQRKHSGSTPHRCHKCHKMFNTRAALVKHEKMRYCDRCRKCYTARSFPKHLLKNCVQP